MNIRTMTAEAVIDALYQGYVHEIEPTLRQVPTRTLVSIADLLHLDPYTVAGNVRNRTSLIRLISAEVSQ